MNRANDNAFPIPGLHTDPDFNGLTKREHFAGLAMQGILTRSHLTTNSELAIAVLAVSCADAILAELAKEKSP